VRRSQLLFSDVAFVSSAIAPLPLLRFRFREFRGADFWIWSRSSIAHVRLGFSSIEQIELNDAISFTQKFTSDLAQSIFHNDKPLSYSSTASTRKIAV
jgi:hypothetical protein